MLGGKPMFQLVGERWVGSAVFASPRRRVGSAPRCGGSRPTAWRMSRGDCATLGCLSARAGRRTADRAASPGSHGAWVELGPVTRRLQDARLGTRRSRAPTVRNHERTRLGNANPQPALPVSGRDGQGARRSFPEGEGCSATVVGPPKPPATQSGHRKRLSPVGDSTPRTH